MSAERLQKILARGADLARRQAEEMIREGRVEVNGTVATLGDHADPEKDAIRVDGRRFIVTPLVRRTILINKPSAVMSTRNDPQGRPTVLDLLPPRLRTGMFPIGRLDFDTEGLLIMTNDGDLAQRIAHPRHGCPKTYEARVKGRPDKRKIDRLRHGIVLFGKKTQPATIKSRPRPAGPRESVTNSWWTIVLREGRTRQVREMFYRVGHPVGRLRRVAIGPIQTGGLPSGGWRELDEAEIARLLEASTPGFEPETKPRSKKVSWTRAGSAARSASKRNPDKQYPEKRNTEKRNTDKRNTDKRNTDKRDAPSQARGRNPNAPETPPGGDDRRGDSRRRPRRGRDDGPPSRAGRGRPARSRDDGPPGRPGRGRSDGPSGRPGRGRSPHGAAESNERGRSRSARAPSRPSGRPGRGPKAGPKAGTRGSTGPKRGGRPSGGSSAGSSRRPGAGGSGSGRGPKPGGGSGRRPKSGGRKGPGGRGGGGRGTR